MGEEPADKQRFLDYNRKIALRVAEALTKKWPHLHLDGFDIDEAVHEIELQLPMTLAEAEAEAEVFAKWSEQIKPPGPSLIGQLRDVLDVPKGTSLCTTLELATLRLAQAKGR